MRGKHLAALLILAGCQGRNADPRPRGVVPAHSGTTIFVERGALFAAEQRRDTAAVDREALSSREVTLRRTAARALARIADAPAADLLTRALSDEDAEVCTWAAYGLGYACHGREAKTVRALVARAASLPSEVATAPPLASPIEAISDALGRCAGTEAEGTLRAWLSGPSGRAEAAALGLGRVASQTGKLEDATLVALLDAADRLPNPLQNALFPLTRLAALNASTADRARSLAQRLATTGKGVSAEFALRILGRTGDAGSAALASLLANTQLAPVLRAQAARELAALETAGQRALWSAFDNAQVSALSDPEMSGEAYGPFSSLLDALQPPILSSGAKLQAFANFALGTPGAESLTRRKVHVRCTAAALLAGSNFQNAQLLACDPAKDSRERELAVLRVIGRGKLRGARKTAYLTRARASDDIVREAALAQLSEHNELGEAYQLLAEALAAKSLGVVASAAHVLARYPERAAHDAEASSDAHGAPNPDPSVVKVLSQAYADAGARGSVEVQSLLLDAIGALQILSLKEAANSACTSDNPTLREHAQKALRLLGEQVRRCDAPKPQPGAASAPPAAANAQLALETDVGPLTLSLDATYAPSAVARVVALVQAGFYDGIVVHRVVPGFVAQFGDPEGDGYGGDDKPPLRCETSPLPFLSGSVGVALSGRDTGSSQLFVTLGRYPHLDGQYAWLGTASPGWDRLAAGDRILRARVSTATPAH
ncbi:MAG: peptidylprolyl isomerase [Polyangiaceae bacterium]